MSPRFYGFLWVLFWVFAAIFWLAGMFTMLVAVVFGSIAFGLVFVGMMCVLPAHVSHPEAPRAKLPAAKIEPRAAKEKIREAANSHVHLPVGMGFH